APTPCATRPSSPASARRLTRCCSDWDSVPATKTKSKVRGKSAKPASTSPKPSSATAKPIAPSRDYKPLDSKRITDLLKRLDANYPDPRCALTHRNAWELTVATILSAQCTDVRVNMVTPELFAKYPTPADLARVEPEQIEPDIRTTGFFRNKSKSIVGAARKVMSDFAGKV